jgi:hypothetical protein
MDRALDRAEAVPEASTPAGGLICSACGCVLTPGRGFVMFGRPRCLRHTISQWRLLRRSLLTALVVGTILTAINQGTFIVAGTLPANLAWKVPLTYLVPFLVTTWGALINTRH